MTRLTPDHLAAVVAVALTAPPGVTFAVVVAEHFGIKRDRAQKWVEKARAAGHPLPRQDGKHPGDQYRAPETILALVCECGQRFRLDQADLLNDHCLTVHLRRATKDERTPK